jgi:hypothetical protein
MSRFRNLTTDVVVSVDDSKDERYANGWEPADKAAPAKKTAAKKAAAPKSND